MAVRHVLMLNQRWRHRGLVQVDPAVLLGISAAAGRIHQELGVAGRQADDTTTDRGRQSRGERTFRDARDFMYDEMMRNLRSDDFQGPGKVVK